MVATDITFQNFLTFPDKNKIFLTLEINAKIMSDIAVAFSLQLQPSFHHIYFRLMGFQQICLLYYILGKIALLGSWYM